MHFQSLIKLRRNGWVVFSVNASTSNWVYDLPIYQAPVNYLAMSKTESGL